MRLLNPRHALVVAAVSLLATDAYADSVAQVQTAKRISRSTVVLIDPQGRPGVVPADTDTTAQPGDILTFVIQFTPVPNGATRGLGGYITDYIPRNTEVVGARIVDSEGNTVPPHRGGLTSDGVGPRGTGDFDNLPEGSLSQLYADTGIFFSTDPLTERLPVGDMADEAFLSLFNGIPMDPEPTGAGQLDETLGAGDTTYAHNRWDWAQALAFGVGGGAIGDGKGNTPHLYGSPVAGPDTWYPYEATFTGSYPDIPDLSTVVANDTEGPWRRIKTVGAETGTMGAVPDANGDMPDPGAATRVGIPAVDGNGDPIGWALSPANPLPAYDPANPDEPYTRAVRFALGELVVGEEYFAEISLRVVDTPLDPVAGMDVNCAEVFGGDASAEKADGTKDGKDNAWRYFLPAPSCVVLNNFFELSVDKIAALGGDTLTYTIEGKNLSTQTQTGVVVRQCFPNDLTFVSADNGGMLDNSGDGCPLGEDSVVWNIGDLDPGEDYLFTTEFEVGGGDTALVRAIYTSDALPDPGFQVVAMTNIKELSVIDFEATATPNEIAALPAQVHYAITVSNLGTGTTTGDRVIVELPDGFTYAAGTSAVDAAGVADPGVVGQTLEFANGIPDIDAGASYLLEFDVDVPAGQPDGSYTIDVEAWAGGAGGGDINDAEPNLAEVLVGVVRSDPPVVDEPLLAGGTSVSGTTTEAAGTDIDVLLNGIVAGNTTSDAAGEWTANVPEMFGGQNVTAVATAAGELPSPESAPPVVVSSRGSVVACSDGEDNDGDGLTDFPDDPGCIDANDIDETDVPACSDGVDNDDDGLTDFPDDPSCSDFRDDTEDGPTQCDDGVDNDNDGDIDTDDADCDDANDSREGSPTACANGIDDDDDGDIDYPFDDGCESATDDDETREAGPGDPDMGAGADGGAADGGGGMGPEDPGGVDAPDSSGGTSEGCCSQLAGDRDGRALGWWALAFALVLVGRRRRQR